jgi:hypothetical protein
MLGAAALDRSSGRLGTRIRSHGRVLGLAVSVVLLISACGPKTEIVYIDPKDHDAPGRAAYTPLDRSTDPRVHQDGAHDLLARVRVGPGAHLAPYAPIGRAHDPRVHAAGKHLVAPMVALAHERLGTAGDSHASSAGASHDDDDSRAPSPTSVPTPAPKPQAVAKPAASSTPPSRLALTTGLGAAPATPTTATLPAGVDDVDDVETVAGRIESIVGKSILVDSAGGKARVRLAETARVDRDALGSPADLKPGMFVGVLHVPSGPAKSVRLYPTGPSMPRPGVVPMVGERQGQVTTFGQIVALQFGGLLLNAGGATANVTLPGTVEILKPAQSQAAELVAGAQIIATGPVTGDGTVVATGVRVTVPSPPER